MEARSIRSSGDAWQYAKRVDWSAVVPWLLGFGLIAYVGLKGGGYDPLVHDQVGIAAWWIVLAGGLVGALPRRRLGPLAWIALGLLAAFALWTALSLVWTESAERTSADLARTAGYLGVFALALFAADAKAARRIVGAAAAAIVCVSIVALLSRIHPDWFSEAAQTGNFVTGGRERLSFPLNYWNALAALVAIGAPLVLQVATCARSVLLRAAAAAALPAMALVAFLTLSRGGIGAAAVALAVFLAFASDRLPKLLTLLLAGGGGAILIAAADRRDALQHGLLDATAQQQGDELLILVLVVCVAVGVLQAGISLLLSEGRRPRWTLVPRRVSLVALLATSAAVLIAAVALGAPGRISDAWSEFKEEDQPAKGSARLGSVAGNGRYELWRSAVEENRSEPLTGTGSGSFEFWWARNGATSETVRDTHSLYLQTLGELGIFGLVILAGFLLTTLVGGAWMALRAGPPERPALAAALAGCTAFCLTAAVDWMWQMPVLVVAFLLLASVLVGSGARPGKDGGGTLSIVPRLAVAVAAAVAIIAIAIPLASTSRVRQSEFDARAGDLAAALEAARSAQNAQPSAASPRLQQALVLEAQGMLPSAAESARAATDRESTNWRTWLVLARIEAERGRASAAVRDYRRAKSLNPHFSLFDR
jgi:O-Antigen ligase